MWWWLLESLHRLWKTLDFLSLRSIDGHAIVSLSSLLLWAQWSLHGGSVMLTMSLTAASGHVVPFMSILSSHLKDDDTTD